MLPTKFRLKWPFGSREEAKNSFQDGRHLGFPIETTLAIFDLNVIPMFSTSFRVNWPFGSGKEAKKNLYLYTDSCICI